MTEQNFIEGFYDLQVPVDAQKYDAVKTFFLSRTKGNIDAAESLTTAFLEVAINQRIDPIQLLQEFKTLKESNNSFRIALIALLNETRPASSKIGFSQRPQPNPLMIRNLR